MGLSQSDDVAHTRNGFCATNGDSLAEELSFDNCTFDYRKDVVESSEGSRLGSIRSTLQNGPEELPEVSGGCRPSKEKGELSAHQQRQLDQETAELQHSRVVSNAKASCSQGLATAPPRVGPNDFELLKIVGQGAFGKVFQVRKKDTGQIYAMKVMRKERVLEKEHGSYVRAEREILKTVIHPYIVALRYSFQTASKLYLVLDFINGGHLFFQLYRQVMFTEDLARLYTAEIVLAISHLHSLGYVHRDLKPENVLLDSNGHVKVTDFGLAKGNMSDDERTNSFIGTMEYMAPEIVGGRGHGKAVDWWSVGILLYEMLCGTPPFKAKSRAQLQRQILGGKLKFPPYLSNEARLLLKALLQREPSKRAGYGPGGSQEVQKSPFFRGISWSKLQEGQVPSPFKPVIKNDDSVENFDKIFTDQAAEDSPAASPRKCEGSAEIFQGFTYVEPSILAASMANLSTSK